MTVILSVSKPMVGLGLVSVILGRLSVLRMVLV